MALIGLAVVADAACADAAASGRVASTPVVSVVSPASKGVVSLVACPPTKDSSRLAQGIIDKRCATRPGTKPYFFGTLTLTVVSSGGVGVSLRYVDSANGTETAVSRATGKISLLAPASTPEGVGPAPASAIPLRKGQPRVIVLGFTLPIGEPLADLDGTLLLSHSAVAIPVTAKLQPLGELEVEPSKLVLSVQRLTDAQVSVDLVGPGVADLLAGPTADSPQVRLGAGPDAPIATLALPSEASANPDRVTATLSLSAIPKPGKYVGDLLLSSTAPGSPHLSLEVDAHRSEWLALLLITIGALLGSVSQPLFTLVRRRAIMRDALQESLAAYCEAGKANPPIASWDISDLVGLGNARGRLQGAPAVLASIEEARSSSDLDDDNSRVLDLVARIQRWLRAEPAARRLRAIRDADPPPGQDRANLAWETSRTCLDTDLLLRAARREPPDAASADDLVARLLRQADWHSALRFAWTHAEDSLSVKDVRSLEGGDAASTAAPGVMSRTAAEQDLLSATLQDRLRAVNLTAPVAPVPPTPAGLHAPNWSASPNLFVGWATLDGPSYGQLVSEGRAPSRAVLSKPQWRPDLGRQLWSYTSGAVVTSMIAVAASLAYLPAAYSDTWGSTSDMLTAATAGLAGHIVIKWTALPYFQSRRLQATSAASAAAAPIVPDVATPPASTAGDP
jgi:hypothetical protein